MKMEISRQLVHLSGLLFVILAQFTGGLVISLYAFLITITLFIYSEIVRREQKRLHGILERLEGKIREIITKFETREVQRPFIGAIWFFFSFGLIFLIFPTKPVNIASALGLILSVGDSLSTLAGIKFGKHRIIGEKTWEGSAVFFATSFLVSLIFLTPLLALVAALVASLAELIPDIDKLRPLKRKGYIDDNLLIPLITGAVLLVFV